MKTVNFGFFAILKSNNVKLLKKQIHRYISVKNGQTIYFLKGFSVFRTSCKCLRNVKEIIIILNLSNFFLCLITACLVGAVITAFTADSNHTTHYRGRMQGNYNIPEFRVFKIQVYDYKKHSYFYPKSHVYNCKKNMMNF